MATNVEISSSEYANRPCHLERHMTKGRPFRKSRPSFFDYLVALALTSVFGCETPKTTTGPKGEELAQIHCGGCHAMPTPDLLDASTWVNGVLPDMGARLGHYGSLSRDSLIKPLTSVGIDPSMIYPGSPVLTESEWSRIVDYYQDAAPDRLEPAERDLATVGSIPFQVRKPDFKFEPPLTTMVSIFGDDGLHYLGNYGGAANALITMQSGGKILSVIEDLAGPPTALLRDGDAVIVSTVGGGPEPTDAANGSVWRIGPSGREELAAGLQRPVDIQAGDLDGDGDQDLVVCEYGHQTGSLSWLERISTGDYRRHVLSPVPGASEAIIHDFNKDGNPDIAALMAQGAEGIDIYEGRGDGTFAARRVIDFPPVYGSNHIEAVDFNADGVMDFLHTNGDNADYSLIPKPYHGLRLFAGAADGSFELAWFFPMNGAISARMMDFDGDEDLDVAAIAYFPDYERAAHESFVYLENQGGLDFVARTFPDAEQGRWLIMDAGDIDGDGDPDLMLGSNIGFGPMGDQTGLYQRWSKEAPSFVVLENTTSGW